MIDALDQSQKLLKKVAENPTATQAQYAEQLGVSKRTIFRMFAILQEQGMLEQQGTRRKARSTTHQLREHGRTEDGHQSGHSDGQAAHSALHLTQFHRLGRADRQPLGHRIVDAKHLAHDLRQDIS